MAPEATQLAVWQPTGRLSAPPSLGSGEGPFCA
jgi:hypothetical protein